MVQFKTENDMNRTLQIVLVCSTFLMLTGMWSCTKEVVSENAKSELYLKTFPAKYPFHFTEVIATDDGGFCIVGMGEVDNVNTNDIYIMKTDKYGQQQWLKEFKSTIGSVPMLSKLEDGNFLVQCQFSPVVAKFDPIGNQLWKKITYPTFYANNLYSKYIEGDDGNLHFTTCQGMGAWTTTTFISTLNQNGQLIDSFMLPDDKVGGKILMINILRSEGGTKWFAGTQFAGEMTSWAAPVFYFVAKLESDGEVTYYRYPDLHIKGTQYLIKSAITKDNELIGLTSEGYWLFDDSYRTKSGKHSFRIYKTSEDLQPIWERSISLPDAYQVSPTNIVVAENGDYLVTGACVKDNSTFQHPFIVRISKDGDLLFNRIYDLSGYSNLIGVAELTNDNYVMTGYSSGFGDQQNNFEAILLVTDPFGDYD